MMIVVAPCLAASCASVEARSAYRCPNRPVRRTRRSGDASGGRPAGVSASSAMVPRHSRRLIAELHHVAPAGSELAQLVERDAAAAAGPGRDEPMHGHRCAKVSVGAAARSCAARAASGDSRQHRGATTSGSSASSRPAASIPVSSDSQQRIAPIVQDVEQPQERRRVRRSQVGDVRFAASARRSDHQVLQVVVGNVDTSAAATNRDRTAAGSDW